jgi:hypothetical protein
VLQRHEDSGQTTVGLFVSDECNDCLLGVVWLIYRDSYVINKSVVYCKIQSALSIYFSISSFSWTVVMGLCLVFSIVKSDPSFTSQYMCFFHIVCWILPGTCIFIM